VRSRIWNDAVPTISAFLVIGGAFLVYIGMFTVKVFWDGANGGGMYSETDWRFVIPGTAMIASGASIIILSLRRSNRESKTTGK
jgi:hypothetical protein